jgi:hypothetical protein
MFFLVDDRCAVIVMGDRGARRANFKCVKEAQKHSPATIRLFETDILGRCRYFWKRKIFCKGSGRNHDFGDRTQGRAVIPMMTTTFGESTITFPDHVHFSVG